jgi:glycosyltransferase involved in cell wall biosynthesis
MDSPESSMSAIKPGKAASTIALSVVLPTCGRMDLLDRCLDALTRQSLPGALYEVIVVDDEPNHNTLHLVAGWRARTLDRGPRLVYLPNSNQHGPAAARNLGWRSSRAPIIAFTDEDTVPTPGWLAQGLAGLTDKVDVVCGRLDTSPAAHSSQLEQAAGDGFSVANCFCRRTMLDQLKGFDERFEQAAHCEADLHFRLLALDARIVHAPEARVVLPSQPLRWGASLARTRDVVFDALLYKKHPQLHRERIAATPPWDDYLAVAALLVALGALLAANSGLALFAGLVWLALTARLCRQRLRGVTPTASHIADVVVTSALIPPLAVFWRLLGAIRYRVRFS